MAPLRRLSSGTPGHQRPISSFFSGTPASSTTPKSSDKPQKPVLIIQPPGSPEPTAHRPSRCDASGSHLSSSPTKRSRLEGERDTSNKITMFNNMSPSPRNRKISINTENVAKNVQVEVVSDSLDAARTVASAKISKELQNVAENEELQLVGRRLKVFWPLDDAWYPGRVKSFNKFLSKHVILYDDGEEEYLRLSEEKVVWLADLDDSAEGHPAKHAHEGNKRKAAVLEDVSDSSIQNRNSNCCKPESEVSREVVSISENATGKLDDEEIVPPSDSTNYKRLKRRRDKQVNYTDMDDALADGSTDDENWEDKAKGANSESDLEWEEHVDFEDEAELKLPKKSGPRSRRRLVRKIDKEMDAQNSSLPDQSNDEMPVKTSLESAVPIREQEQKIKLQRQAKIIVSENEDQNATASCSKQPAEANGYSLNVQLPRSPIQIFLEGEATERFGGRVAEKFKFLGKNRKDTAGRRLDDPQFDNRTLFLPPDFVKNLSAGQRQWWEFKSKHMDKVLFFKMGKFYELFEMDAHIGAHELDLQYMKGDQPHCGFPEKNYSENVGRLVRKGYRVLVVEQTETPEQLEQRRRETGVKDKVVNREVCAIITKGTMVDDDMVAASPDAAFLLSITETIDKALRISEGAYVLGVCAADAARSVFMLGQFVDDPGRTKLRAVLAELRPVELIKPRGMLTEATERALKDHTRQPLVNDLEPVVEFWDSERCLKEITRLYSQFQQEKLSSKQLKSTQVASKHHACQDKSNKYLLNSENFNLLPDLLSQVVKAGKRGEAALSAFGGCLSYLRMVMLDESLLQCCRFELLPGSDNFAETKVSAKINESEFTMPETFHQNVESQESMPAIISSRISRNDPEPYMVLDAAALENLEILENSDGGTSGTLLGLMDHCVTSSGRRLLKQWLVRPLLNVQSILQRQYAVSDLQGPAASVVSKFRKELQGLPDMERLLARLNTSCGGTGRNSQRVVLYEDAAKKQLKEFLAAVRGCRAMTNAMSPFESCIDKVVSTRLKSLVTIGKGFPYLAPHIKKFEASFDWLEAEKNGRIIPCVGVDEAFDFAQSEITTVKQELDNYLEKQRKKFGNCLEITYVTVGKDSYQLEIPDHLHAKVPLEYEARSSKKGYHRFVTPKIKELLQKLGAAEEQREIALKGIFHGLLKRFCEAHNTWLEAVTIVAEIDALVSLSSAGLYMEGQVCQPKLLGHTKSSNLFPSFRTTPYLMAKALRHPLIGSTLVGGGSFVPNDVVLGGEGNAPLMLLTGPNMGGKSTLLRQICLAVILAQVGASVPAEEFQLSPVDRLFVRLGAKDHIIAGKSTFLLELSETASMLNFATRNSLVALDELGRGTATSDGEAIAYAVLKYFSQNIGCLGMFSSHYHRLADEHADVPAVASYHMACKVGTGAGGLEEVTFLYNLTHGACPKSYGVNVARLAGMPETVLERATSRSTEMELCEKSNLTWKSRCVYENVVMDLFKSILGIQKHQTSHPVGAAGLMVLWEKVKEIIVE